MEQICLFLLTNETVPCMIVGLFFVEKIISEFSVKIGLSLNKKKIQQFTIGQFSSECLIRLSRIVLVLLNSLCDWSNKFAPPSQPIRFKP